MSATPTTTTPAATVAPPPSTLCYHYTRMGVRIAPTCADGAGYVTVRTGYEALPAAEWTEAEQWTAQQELRIAEWRRQTKEQS